MAAADSTATNFVVCQRSTTVCKKSAGQSACDSDSWFFPDITIILACVRAHLFVVLARLFIYLIKSKKNCRKNATVGWLIGNAHALTGNSHFRVLFARILQFTYCHRAIVSKSNKVFSFQMTTGSLPGRSLGSISHIFRSSSHLVGPLFITSLK